jgi:hypothetical protein
MSYSKIGIPRVKLGIVHPFKIDILKDGSNADGTPKLFLAVNYHSRIYSGMGKTGKYLQWLRVPGTETSIPGTDLKQEVPSTFPGQNYYCVLKITVNDLQATKAEIIWVSNDKSVNDLQPITFQDGSNLKQTEARIIIGVLVSDDEAVAGTPRQNDSGLNTPYIVQLINTNLIMCNMVFDGIPVIYPVPFGGGRLNFS